MQRSETVVGRDAPLTKLALHALVMTGWARAIKRLGKGRFADALDISGPGLDKQLSGSMPTLEMIDRALCVEPSVLDDWLSERGKRLVDEDAVCDADDASVLIARLQLWFSEATHPASPGGRAIVHTELLDAELMIRQLHKATGDWLETIRQHRGVAA